MYKVFYNAIYFVLAAYGDLYFRTRYTGLLCPASATLIEMNQDIRKLGAQCE